MLVDQHDDRRPVWSDYSSVMRVNYNNLMNLVGELSLEFFDKFASIAIVIATRPFDRDQFEWFLKNVSQLSHLILFNTSPNRAFLDDLPNRLGQLVKLEITESQTVIDFNFILNFPFLSLFRTNQQIEGPTEFKEKVIRKFGNCCCLKSRKPKIAL